ncbi:DUF4383 domain-containing protein [Actinophytocola glycyrrhizae]|uniref:DUF4383 domain-containing protein n=1 Tax=Actinophytocola glycyrrhizae TaxID=2044873 RepID=A0ABV9S6H6_9PSEU
MIATMPKAARRARLVVLVLGVVYLALAVAGIVVVGWGEIRESDPAQLFGVLGVSRLLDIAHAVLAAGALLAAVRGAPTAFAAVATVAFTAMAAFGLVAEVVGDAGDPLHMTWWNVGLYLLSALTCLYVYTLRVKAQEEGNHG